MGSFDLHRFTNAEPLAQAAATEWLDQISALKSKQSLVSVALSGGRIARDFLAAVAHQVSGRRLSFAAVHFFWGDERCVPPGDPESNFRLANELLFRPLDIAAAQIHRIPCELPPESAAAAAENALRQVLGLTATDPPVFDSVILGMGEDGHVASLFPGEPEEVMTSLAVFRCVTAAKPPPLRITLGYPALAAARQVWVLASGLAKQRALRESLDPNGATPLARVLRLRSSTSVYSDIQMAP